MLIFLLLYFISKFMCHSITRLFPLCKYDFCFMIRKVTIKVLNCYKKSMN